VQYNFVAMKKTIVITGGTGGIGYAVAKALAKQGNDIIFQGRDANKGKKIASELSNLNGSNARFIAADVSSVDGIKDLAAGIKQLTNKIDIFIQATGVLYSERSETKDGFYGSFPVNYLCKFMLDDLLLDELKLGQGKIIIIGGPLRKGALLNFNDLHMKTNYTLFRSIGQNQLAVHMHAQEFSKRNGGSIPINVVNAGMVKTGIDRNVKGFMKLVFIILGPVLANSIEKAIVNVIALADTDDKDSGYFYPKVGQPAIKEKINLDPAVASTLWDESLKIGKLN